MKIRYYLRGLGLGILFTSVFFLVSNGNSTQTMSDEQIKTRAKELGMIESTVLADISTEEKETVVEETIVEEEFSSVEAVTEENVVEETETEEVTTEDMEEDVVIEETTTEETESESEEAEPVEDTEAEEPESITSNSEPVSIMVNRGDGSDTVSRRLQEAGLVADAYEYDRYLMANGYDKRIGAGEHIIPAGATWEEIAKVLCN